MMAITTSNSTNENARKLAMLAPLIGQHYSMLGELWTAKCLRHC